MVALGIFLVICGAAFALLSSSQKRFQSDTQVLNSFQEARLGMDQMVRDINDSGFPPPSSFNATAAPSNLNLFASTPFAWSPGYQSNTPCSVSVSTSCTTPSQFDLIIETNITPQVPSSPVMWVRYQLQGQTLMRGVLQKDSTADPVNAFNNTPNTMVPYIQNVMNNATSSQIAQFQASYPTMFPGGNPVPIFKYFCDTGAGTLPCASAADKKPQNILTVSISLIVMAPLPDAQSGQARLVELDGLARRINPNQ
jgi:type II secretory pathway pseudopilin PulG